MCMEDEVDSLVKCQTSGGQAAVEADVQVIRDVESVCLDSGRVGAGCETAYK
jgi:hypothetical protein